MDPLAFWSQLNLRAESMGIHFGPQKLMSNSSKAMQAGEFAKLHDRYEAYHGAVFNAFFTDCKDIGDTRIILDIAQSIGLDVLPLEKDLDAGMFKPVLEATTQSARSNMITSAPTFIIDGQTTITGAEPIENFRNVLNRFQKEKVTP